MGKINIYNNEDLAAVVAEAKRDNRIAFHNEVFLDHLRDGKYLCFEESQGFNIMPTEGLNSVLDIAVGATAKESAWYVGIFKGNYTPISTNTAANALGAVGLFTECQDADYDAATNRPGYTIVAASGGVITNSASKAQFTIKQSITVYGAFVASSQAKTATTGKLLAAKRFDASRAVVASDILYVTYQITATSA